MFKVGDKVKRIVDITPLKKGEIYTVSAVEEDLWCIGVSEYVSINDATPFDMNNFEFVCFSGSPFNLAKQPVNEDEIVVEWLRKLQYLHHNDIHLVGLDGHKLELTTDFGDVYGTENIAKFVDNRYDNYMQAAKAKRKESLLKELQEKEAEVVKLKEELASL